MKNTRSMSAFSAADLQLNMIQYSGYKLKTSLEGTWVDTELMYVDSDKETILEKELVYQNRESDNCLSFKGNTLDVSMFVEEFDKNITITKYATNFSFENNMLSFWNKYAEVEMNIEVLKLTNNEMWIVIQELSIEKSPLDKWHSRIYEVAKLVKQ